MLNNKLPFENVVIDIECNSLLGPALDYSSMPYKLKDTIKLWCIVLKDINNPSNSLLLVQEENINTIYPTYKREWVNINDRTKPLVREYLDIEKNVVSTEYLNNHFTIDMIKNSEEFDVCDYQIQENIWYNNKKKIAISKENLKDCLKNAKIIVGHNIINYDLPMLYLFNILEYSVGYPGKSSKLFNKDIKIIDTLILSKILNPDRNDFYGKHSLASFGLRAGNPKIDFHEFDKFSPFMCFYCDQDTSTNIDTLHLLNIEKEEYDINWDNAIALEQKLMDLTLKQEVVGFELDVDLCHKNVETLEKLLNERENIVVPKLPPKPMTKAELAIYTPPIVQFKKDGSISSTIINFANKINNLNTENNNEETQKLISYSLDSNKLTLNIDTSSLDFDDVLVDDIVIFDIMSLKSIDVKWKPNKAKTSYYCKIPDSIYTPISLKIPLKNNENITIDINNPKTLTEYIKAVPSREDPDSFEFYLTYKGKEFKLPYNNSLETHTKPDMKANELIKEYLLDLGWDPTEWNERDITKDSSKKTLSEEKVFETIERYVQKTFSSGYRLGRLDVLGLPSTMDVDDLRDYFIDRYKSNPKKPIKVPTSPKIKVGTNKDIDEKLFEIPNNKEFSTAVAEYYTYKHRKSCIAGGDIDEETGEPTKGYLANYRPQDNRIPTPADTIGAGTHRYTHRVVANVPRNTSIFGEEMRGLFKAGKNWIQAAFDFASLEARIEGHHVYKYPTGPELVESLLAEKGATLETSKDIHSITAVKLGITRDSAKNINYGILYGAQWPKLVKMLNITEAEAKKMYNDFWDAVPALKALKEDLEAFWEETGRKYILAIDGRKINIRSAHSLLNFLFQGNGAIMSKWSVVRIAEQFEEQGLLGNPFVDNEDAIKVWQMIVYHDEIQYAIHRKLMKVKVFNALTEEEKQLHEEQKDRFKSLSKEEQALESKPLSRQEIEEIEFKINNKELGQFSDVGHLADGRSFIGLPGIFSKTLLKGVKIASEENKLEVDLGISWVTGTNWKECH